MDTLKKLIQNNPDINLWEYIQQHSEQAELLFGIESAQLFELIELAKNLYKMRASRLPVDGLTRQEILSIEQQILLTIIHINKRTPFDVLSILFKVKESHAEHVFQDWFSLFNRYKNRYREIRNFFDKWQRQKLDSTIIRVYDTPGRVHLNEIEGGLTLNSTLLARKITIQEGGGLPISTSLKTLPNNGLFVRRNNQFGTRLSVGIKDLIEQGLLIDQTNIRFDDFVAPNSEKIPSPSDGSSIAVSYGITSIPLNQKRDDRATHYLEIALKASDATPSNQPKNQAPPVNYVFVIDTSGSMEGEKLDSVKESIRELFNAMKTDDVIGIIEFNTRVNTILKAKPKGRITDTEFSHAISSLRATGSTDINMGLQFGINEIGRYGNNNRLNHVYLFSDGNPNSGETDWIKIRQNVDAKTRDTIRLSTFAFGSDANVRELDALAGLTGGKSTFVTDIDDIKVSLQEELNRREYVAGINVQIKVEIDQEISILYLYGHDEITDPARRAAVLRDAEQAKEKAEEEFGVESAPDLITQEDGIRIFVPDLTVGETYWIVFELGIPAEKSQNTVGKATVQYVDTFARTNRSHEVNLSSLGVIDAELVIQHALGLWSSEVAFYTLDDLYEKDFQTAKDRIANHVKLLRAANDDLESEFIADDIVVFEKFMSLSQNLGRRLLPDEAPRFPSGSAAVHPVQAYFLCSLNDYGRVKNGFNRMTL
ncbi:MAG TPA: VWA domain-containing protein [Stenomitos sp.]